jgi:hypothetical protein
MQYLLGTLSEEERERIEERYFSDDAQFEEVEIAEEELLDRYVRGELSASDAAQFEVRVARSTRLQERVEFAKLFAQRLRTAGADGATSSRKTWWQRLFGFTDAGRGPQLALAFSTLLALVAATVMLVGWMQLRSESRQLAAQQAALDQRQRELDKQAADLKAQIDQFARQGYPISTETPLPQVPQESAPQVVFLTLAPGATRSVSGTSQIRILPGTSEVQLTLNLRASEYSSYRATINSTDHRSVFSKSDLKSQTTSTGDVLMLRVPAQNLPQGDYYLTLHGEPANERVDDYAFRVIKQ